MNANGSLRQGLYICGNRISRESSISDRHRSTASQSVTSVNLSQRHITTQRPHAPAESPAKASAPAENHRPRARPRPAPLENRGIDGGRRRGERRRGLGLYNRVQVPQVRTAVGDLRLVRPPTPGANRSCSDGSKGPLGAGLYTSDSVPRGLLQVEENFFEFLLASGDLVGTPFLQGVA